MRPALAAFSLAALLALGAAAQGPNAGGPTWGTLTASQRQALAPLERDWAGIDATRKSKWLEVAARFPKMPVQEQQRIQERMRAWVLMSPEQRGNARLTFQESRQITPEERQQRWEAYQNMAPEQRQALAAKPAAAASSARDAHAANASASNAKKTLVSPGVTQAGGARVVAPTLVQPQAGATTSLVTKLAPPPVHQQPGMPKIAATPNFVDRTTLLPKRGPQGAESRGVANAASAPASQTP